MQRTPSCRSKTPIAWMVLGTLRGMVVMVMGQWVRRPITAVMAHGALNGDFLNDPAFGWQRFVDRLQVEFDGLANVFPGLFEAIAFGDAAGRSRDEGGVAAFIGRFEDDS